MCNVQCAICNVQCAMCGYYAIQKAEQKFCSALLYSHTPKNSPKSAVSIF